MAGRDVRPVRGGLNSCIKQIRRALGDSRQSPRYLETLTRRGYRFIAPVTVVAEPHQADPRGRLRIRLQPVRDLDAPSPGAGHALAKALHEELAAQLALAAPRDIAVVARAPEDQAGHETAEYDLRTSVRAAGSRARVTSQLIDTRSRQHVWAGRFDASLDHPLDAESALADRIVDGVVAAIRGVGDDNGRSGAERADQDEGRRQAERRSPPAGDLPRSTSRELGPGPHEPTPFDAALRHPDRTPARESARGHRHDHAHAHVELAGDRV